MTDASGSIMTVTGPIDPEDLGVTITHEHVFIDMRNWLSVPESAYERDIAEEPVSQENLWYVNRKPMASRDNLFLGSKSEAIDEIEQYAQAGGSSIIEVTPKGNTGQDPEQVREVGRQTGVQFIQGTAYYVRTGHPERIDTLSEDELEAEFVSDVREGIDDTDVRAGIIGEIGLSVDENAEIYDAELKVLRAGARAAARTGTSLSIHPPGRIDRARKGGEYPTSRWGLDVLDIVEAEGLPADRVVMDHMDRSLYSDVSYQKELAERGAYLEYDLFGSEFYYDHWNDGYPSDKWRIDAVMELIDEGYLTNLLFSQDVCQKIQRTKYGGNGYAHILRNVVPMLRYHGVSDEEITTILEENPRRMLTIEEPVA
jgi:phosphotriesterase-related protein